MKYTEQVQKWGIFEFSVDGRTDGNPFVDYVIKANFKCDCESKTVNGFYDGNGIYKVRFMPSFEGKYEFEVSGTFLKKYTAVNLQLSLPKRATMVLSKCQMCTAFNIRTEQLTAVSVRPAMCGICKAMNL